MIKIENLEGRFKQDILLGVNTALKNVNIITDEKLRNCVKNRLEKSGKIRIRCTPKEDNEKITSNDCYKDPNLGGQHKSYGIGKWEIHSKKITLCVDNLAKNRKLDILWKYVLHEFAHSCGWEDGQNKGVPFPDGYP